MRINLPGAFWVALLLGLNEALQTLDLHAAPRWVTVAVFLIAALAKGVQEELRNSRARSLGQSNTASFIWRVLFY